MIAVQQTDGDEALQLVQNKLQEDLHSDRIEFEFSGISIFNDDDDDYYPID